ncbi:MAG TPA: response regulator [Acidimicrobiales bacterium]|nr:response regulator [Acidimicrobiales bacterium]
MTDDAGAGGMLRVLVVDDDPDIRALLAMNLELSGYHVTQAPNGRQGSDLARALRPDLILLDVMMPEMDGLDVLRGLKADPETSEIPVVMLTAKTEDSTVWQGWELGAAYFLTKPFELPQLLHFIETLAASEDHSLN